MRLAFEEKIVPYLSHTRCTFVWKRCHWLASYGVEYHPIHPCLNFALKIFRAINRSPKKLWICIVLSSSLSLINFRLSGKSPIRKDLINFSTKNALFIIHSHFCSACHKCSKTIQKPSPTWALPKYASSTIARIIFACRGQEAKYLGTYRNSVSRNWLPLIEKYFASMYEKDNLPYVRLRLSANYHILLARIIGSLG